MGLIDADKLLDILDVMIVGHKSASDVYDVVDSMPIVDAVPVVRCKNCKWRNGLRCYHKRSSMDDLVGENDFCSLGERKEDGKID